MNGRCRGLHCEGCGKGGLSAGAIVALILFVLAVVNRHAIGDGVGEFLHVVEMILEVVLFTLLALVAAAAAAVMVWAGIRIRRWQQRRQAVAAPAQVIALTAQQSNLAAQHRQAIAQPRAASAPAIAPARPPLYVHTQAEPREVAGRVVPSRPRRTSRRYPPRRP